MATLPARMKQNVTRLQLNAIPNQRRLCARGKRNKGPGRRQRYAGDAWHVLSTDKEVEMTLPQPGQASAEIPITGRDQIDACTANANAGLVVFRIGKCGRATLSHIC